MRRTQGKHTKAVPTRRAAAPKGLGRGRLVLAALAVVVAAVVAIPGLVALAAPSPVSVSFAAVGTPQTDVISGEDVWSSEATYTVSVTVAQGYELNQDQTTVLGGDVKKVDWAQDGTWQVSQPDADGAVTYTRNVTVQESAHEQISIRVAYQQSDAEQPEVQTDDSTYDRRVTVDKSAPVVTIQMSQPTIGSADGTDYFGEDGLSATVTVKDPTFDPNASTVKKETVTWETTGNDTYTATYDDFNFGLNYGFTKDDLSVEAADKLRHKTTFDYGATGTTDSAGAALSGGDFTVDENRPEVSFTLNGAAPQTNNHFTQDVTVVATVKMANYGSVTGLDETDGWTESPGETDDDRVETRTYTKTFNAEGTYDVSVTAKKRYGTSRTGEGSLSLTIDRTAPTMAVSFDNNTAVNGNNYAAPRTATITVNEALGFDEGKISVLVNGEAADGVTWAANGTTHTATVPFDEDGTYELTVSGTDLAGNSMVMADDASETEYSSGEFVIDTTNPTLTPTWDNENVQNKKYYQAPRTLTVVADDAHLNADSLVVKVDDAVDDTVAWETQQDGSLKAVVPFTTEGAHSVQVSCEDNAGNDYTYDSGEFVIDLTDPVIELTWQNTGFEGESTYFDGGRVATITVDEENFRSDLINIQTTGTVGAWDEEKQSVTVTFANDGDYRLQVTGSDLAGNSADPQDSGDFVIDTTAPVLSVSFADGDEATDVDGSTSYYDADRTATISVVEKNFDPARVSITGAGEQGTWQDGEGDEHTLEVTFPESASPYQMTVRATDRAGNGSVDGEGSAFTYDSGTFVVDKTAPTVSIQLDQPLVQTFGGVDYFSAAPTATVTVRDVNFKAADSILSGTGATVGAWVEGETDDTGVTTWTSTVTFTEGTGRDLAITASDWAGHDAPGAYGTDTTDSAGTPLSSATFTADLTAPEVTSASVDRDPSNNYGDNYYFNAATTLTVNVSDNIGIESLSMTDADDGTYVLDNQVNVGASEGTVTIGFQDGRDFDRAVIVRTTDLAHNYRYWSIAPDGTVEAVNYADPSNEPVFDGTYPETMLQDTVAPVVSLSGVEAGSYYNSAQSVVLSVQELNVPILRTYEPDQVVLTVTQVSGDASRATRTWTRPLSQLSSTGEGIGYALSEPLSADGHYTVSAQVTDPAKNQDTAELGEFTIDMTAPVVEVSFDNNDVRNGKYYNAGRTATITVTEHNFDPELVSIETNGSVGSWSTSGDVHTAQVSFSADGVYNLAVSGSDRAGNTMEPYQADEFVVDTEAPQITFGGVEDQTAYNGEVAPSISFVDEANFDPNGVSYTITGSKNGTLSYEAGTSSEGQGQTVSYANFVREPEVDDIYTINAQMSDLAGNEAEGSITFSVNRFGSTFRVLDSGSYTENDGYLTERRDVLVEEINVSGVTSENHGVTVTEGTNVDELTLNDEAQDSGYTIESDTSTDEDSNGWSVYTYRIAAGNFDRDGRYHVSVTSNDRADNTNSSSSYFDREAGETAAAEVDFILDTTDPVITNLSVADGATYEAETYEGSFTVVENIGIRDVEVLVDGEPVEATDDGFGNYIFQVSSASFTPRSLEITATDLAGRSGTAGASDFHVTTDIFELHLPWVITGVAAVAAIAGGSYYVLVVKKRRDEKDEAAA